MPEHAGTITIVVESDPTAHVVRVAGELDLNTRVELEAVLAGLARPPHIVVLEFSELTFVDSTGLKTLLDEHRKARAERYEFAIAGATARSARCSGSRRWTSRCRWCPTSRRSSAADAPGAARPHPGPMSGPSARSMSSASAGCCVRAGPAKRSSTWRWLCRVLVLAHLDLADEAGDRQADADRAGREPRADLGVEVERGRRRAARSARPAGSATRRFSSGSRISGTP